MACLETNKKNQFYNRLHYGHVSLSNPPHKVLCLVWIIKQMSPYYFGSFSVCLNEFYIRYKSNDDGKRMERIRLLVQLFGFFGGHNYLFHQITSFLGTDFRLWFSFLSGMDRNLLFFSLWFFYMERWHRVLFCLFCLALLALRNKEKCWQCFVITMYLLYILKKVTLVQNISWIDTDCEFGIFPHAQSSKKNKHSLSIYSQLNQFNRFRWLLKCPGFLYQRKQKRPKGVGKVLREETMCLSICKRRFIL